MKIRRGKESDVKQITKLRKDNLKKVDAEKYPKKIRDFLIKRDTDERNLEHLKKRDYFCLVEEDKIIGTISLDKDEIGDFFIKSDCIRQGNGLKLINYLEGFAKKKGFKKIGAVSTQHSKGFYEKAGFVIKGRIDKGNGRINLIMEKKLKWKTY